MKNVLNKEEWNDLIKTIQKKGIHIYRTNKNRQGHDNNHLSYWALGFNSIQEMMNCVSKEEFEKYTTEHANCCGFYEGKYSIIRRCDKGMGVTKKRKENYFKKEGQKDSNNIIIGRGAGRGAGRGRGIGIFRRIRRIKRGIRGRGRGSRGRGY